MVLLFPMLTIGQSTLDDKPDYDKIFEQILPVLCEIESNNDPCAVGDGGESFGILQIQYPYLEDAIEYDLSLRPIKSLFNIEYSKKVFRAYMRRQIAYTKKNEGRWLTELDIVSKHNGGWRGHEKYKHTLKYVAKYLKIKRGN